MASIYFIRMVRKKANTFLYWHLTECFIRDSRLVFKKVFNLGYSLKSPEETL